MRTSKKIVSLILAVMMVVSMMVVGVVSASAAAGVINDQASLAEACANGGEYVLGASFTSTGADVAAGKELVLDLADQTLTVPAWGFRNYGKLTVKGTTGKITATRGAIDNYGELVLAGGTIESTESGQTTIWNNAGYNASIVIDGSAINSNGFGINSETGCTVTMNSGSITATNTGIATSGTATVNGGTVTADLYGITVWGANAALTVNGGTVEGISSAGISGNGSSGNEGYVINVNGGTVTGGSAGIYHPNFGTLNITGGTIVGATGIYVKAGQTAVTSISGATVIGNGAKTAMAHSGNGFNPTGDAVVVENCGYPGGTPNVEIAGGNYVSENAAAVASYGYSTYAPIEDFISGGEFTGADDMSDAIIADGVTKVQLDTDTEIIAKGTINNETDLATAIAAGGYWVVGDNFTITNNTDVPAGTDFTLNLGGKTVTVTPWTFKNHGNLTVTGEGNMNADKGIIDNYGNLVLSGGTYATTLVNPAFWNNTSDSSIVVDGATINAKGVAFRNEKGTITINSGSVNSEDSAILNDAGVDVVVNGGTIKAAQYGVYNEGTTTVNGGSIESASEGSIGVANTNANSTLTVNGGTIKATQYGVYNAGTTTVNGGTIEGETGIGSKGTVTVDGGTIAGDSDGWGIVTWAGSTTNVNDGTITGGYGISGNGNETGYTINVTGGTITGDDLGIYNPGYGYVNISGGTIEGATAVYSKSGETNISGGTLRAVLQPGKSYDYYGNGGKPTGDAVVIDNCNYPGGTPSVSITGGNFETTDDSKDAVHSYVQSDDEDLPATVTNPTTDNARITGFISGGTFSSDVTELCADGLVAEGSGSTFSIVPFTTDGKADIDGYQRKVYNGSPESTQLTGNDITTQGVRIITMVDRDWLDANADDYGYIVGKVTDSQTKTFDQPNTNFTSFTAANGAKKISCVGSENAGLGLDEDSITLAINGMEDGQKAVARFYVELNGVTYYANYSTYTGILAAY